MQFSVKKIEAVVFLWLFVLFCSLGIWQLKRADEKSNIEKKIQVRSQQQVRELDGKRRWDKDEIEYQKVSVRGKFLSHGQLLIDNIVVASQPGYHVITPLKIAGTDQHVLVNRGWVAQGASRQELPLIELPSDTLEIEGIVRTPSALPFVDSTLEALSLDKAYSVWLYVDLQKYQQESQLRLLPFLVRQNNDSGDGLLRDWPPYQAKVGMHIGYAIQWFALAIITTIFFIGLGRKRGKNMQGLENA